MRPDAWEVSGFSGWIGGPAEGEVRSAGMDAHGLGGNPDGGCVAAGQGQPAVRVLAAAGEPVGSGVVPRLHESGVW